MKLPNAAELWRDPEEKIRDFGKAAFVVLALFGALAARRALAHQPPLPDVGRMPVVWDAARHYWLAGWAILTFSTAFPWATRPVYVLANLAGMAIGFVFGHVVLAAMFFGMFALIGHMRRGSSPVKLHFDRQAASYWTNKAKAKSQDRYYRQY